MQLVAVEHRCSMRKISCCFWLILNPLSEGDGGFFMFIFGRLPAKRAWHRAFCSTPFVVPNGAANPGYLRQSLARHTATIRYTVIVCNVVSLSILNTRRRLKAFTYNYGHLSETFYYALNFTIQSFANFL